MDEWLSSAADSLADASGVPRAELDLDRSTEMTLLDVARVAAHASDARTNAPLLCYLIGVARGSGTPLETLADAVAPSPGRR